MIYDESIKYMDIYVQYGRTSKFIGTNYKTFIYDKDGNKLPGLDFKNGYGKNPGNDPTPNDKVKELKVNKVLKNSDGTDSTDTTKEFDVTINIKGQVGDIFTYNGQTYEITEANVADGVSIGAKINNKGTLTIDGLTDNDTVTVKETFDEKKYTVTGQLTEDTLVKDIENQTVTITNKESIEVPTTGLLNTIAPFILIIGLAGGFAVIYFKKNKSELA